MRLIGMVHLPPLPGSPRWDGSMERAIAVALADARALVDNGMDALIVENYGDAPFTRGRVGAATVAAMAVIAHEIRRALPDAPLGVNVLKSDARSALAVATAIGARFIRVNVLAGAVVADQGIVQTDAHDLLRDRRLLGVDVAIFADVQGKHAMPLAPVELEQQARDLAARALADGLVVSGRATGDTTPIEDVKRVRSAVPDVPILVGSGVTPETAPELLSLADALIVGTSLKRDGDVSAPSSWRWTPRADASCAWAPTRAGRRRRRTRTSARPATSRRRSWRRGASAACSAPPASTGTSRRWWTWATTRPTPSSSASAARSGRTRPSWPPRPARTSPACTPPASSPPSSTSPVTARASRTRTRASSTSPTPRGRTSSWSPTGCCWPRASWTP